MENVRIKKPKVYFSKEISAEKLVEVYNAMGRDLGGKVAVKISTGEPGGHHYLKPELIKDLVQKLEGTIVECNTAYKGKRFDTESHKRQLLTMGILKLRLLI